MTWHHTGVTISRVSEKPLKISYMKGYAALLAIACVLSMVLATPLHAQSQKPDLPDPVKFVNKLDVVWNVVKAVLQDMGFNIELEDRKAGKLVTRPSEFITGTLTPSEVEKVAVTKDMDTKNWSKAHYSVDALLEIVTPVQTMVTITTKIEALNHDVDGTEKWVPLDSLGVLERRVLSKVSMKLLGNDNTDTKKGFWNKSPQPVNQRPSRLPTPPPE